MGAFGDLVKDFPSVEYLLHSARRSTDRNLGIGRIRNTIPWG